MFEFYPKLGSRRTVSNQEREENRYVEDRWRRMKRSARYVEDAAKYGEVAERTARRLMREEWER